MDDIPSLEVNVAFGISHLKNHASVLTCILIMPIPAESYQKRLARTKSPEDVSTATSALHQNRMPQSPQEGYLNQSSCT